MTTIDELKELGFETAAKAVEEKQKLYAKMHTAYQNFEFVTQEDIDAFNEQLKAKTLKKSKYQDEYQTLSLTSVKNYKEAPPQEVITKMRDAVQLGCFDTFEIAKIEAKVEVKDPILFGRITGCGDRFFIAQWDNDVTMEMIKATRKE